MNQPAETKKLEGKEIVPAAGIQTPEKNPIDGLKRQMFTQRDEFKLPSHISFDKFQRTVVTACVQNPKLLFADRRSLLLSCVKAATDGLLPDGREAALVLFNTKVKDADGKDVWVDMVQYMPMTFGILKKVRQSDLISMVVAHVVYQKDEFEYVLGDNERVEHKPYTGTEDRGPLVAAYAIAKFKDGMIQREVMTLQDIEKVRRVSKAGSATENDVKYKKANAVGDPKGIWKDWYEEMARKTAFRRLAKWLPQSIDKEGQDQLFGNDETMDVLDNYTPDAGTEEKPLTITQKDDAKQLTDDSGQPDLGSMIDKANAKDAEREQVEQEQEKPQPQPKEKAASKSVEKPEPEKADTQKTTLETIVDAINNAQNDGDLDGIWNVEFSREIATLSKSDREKASQAYSAAVKRFNQAQGE